jgi:hypothetical protein
LHAEPDVPGLVLFVIGHEVSEHWLEALLAHLLEDGERNGLDHELHPEDFRGQVIGVEDMSQERLGRRIQPFREIVELLQIVVHRVEVACFVVGLARGGHFGFERLQPVSELRGYLPRSKLAPENDRKDAFERLALLRKNVNASMLRDEHREDLFAIPRDLLTLVVDALTLFVTPGFVPRARERKHVVGQRRTAAAEDSHGRGSLAADGAKRRTGRRSARVSCGRWPRPAA